MENRDKIILNGEIIFSKKKELDGTDWKMNRYNEYEKAGLEQPISHEELHAERQALRDEINTLELENERLEFEGFKKG